jgi:hypothetical protein
MGNIQLMCFGLNAVKGNFTYEELEEWHAVFLSSL